MMKAWKVSILVLTVFLSGLSNYALAATAVSTVTATVVELVNISRDKESSSTFLTVNSTGITTGNSNLVWTTTLEGEGTKIIVNFE